MSKSVIYNSKVANDSTQKYQNCWFQTACIIPIKKTPVTPNKRRGLMKRNGVS